MKFIVSVDYIYREVRPCKFRSSRPGGNTRLMAFCLLKFNKNYPSRLSTRKWFEFLYEFLVDVYFHVESCTACIMQLDLWTLRYTSLMYLNAWTINCYSNHLDVVQILDSHYFHQRLTFVQKTYSQIYEHRPAKVRPKTDYFHRWHFLSLICDYKSMHAF